MCERERESVCVGEREREREYLCVCERKRDGGRDREKWGRERIKLGAHSDVLRCDQKGKKNKKIESRKK